MLLSCLYGLLLYSTHSAAHNQTPMQQLADDLKYHGKLQRFAAKDTLKREEKRRLETEAREQRECDARSG